MGFVNLKDTIVYRFANLSGFGNISHFISTREGGHSLPPFNGLNIGFGTDDLKLNVLNNRKVLAENIGCPIERFVFPKQTHSSNIVSVNTTHMGLGVYEKETAISDTDAVITNQLGVCVVVQVADCVPLLFFDPVKKVIAAVHAGWRGTAKSIGSKTIAAMVQKYGSQPNDIVVGIGPSIGNCCYEVGDEVAEAFIREFEDHSGYLIPKEGKWQLDLWLANKSQLINAGIAHSNIEISGLCTKCNSSTFFSSRHDNGNTGRFLAGIMIL